MECPDSIICERCGATIPKVEEDGQKKYICTGKRLEDGKEVDCGFFLITTSC